MLVGLLLRVLLACVLVIAGGLKVFSLGRTAVAVRGFGLPRRSAWPIAVTLPVVELLTAALLVGDRSDRVGALIAAGLLAAFVALTAAAVLRGRSVSCQCFGNLSASAVTAKTVWRNVGLLAVALAAVGIAWGQSHARGVAYSRLDATQWAVVGLAIAVVVLGCAFWRAVTLLLEQHGRLLLRLDELDGGPASSATPQPAPAGGLVRGAPAPEFELASLAGDQVSLDSLIARRRPVLLVFSDVHCGPCGEIMPAVGHWQREHGDALTTLVVATGSADDNAAKAREYELTEVVLDANRAVAASYESPGTPSAVLIGGDGIVIESAAGAAAIQHLAGTAIGGHEASAPDSTVTGKPVPSFTLPDLAGAQVTEASLGDRDLTVVLFWNPECGFCQRMQPRLQQWRMTRSDADAPLLIVANGNAEALTSLAQLDCTVVLDDGALTRQFGAAGTPMALLVDAEGVIRSEFAAGEQAVFELLEPLTTDRPRLPVLEGGTR